MTDNGQVPMDLGFKAALVNTTAHGATQAAAAGQMTEQIASLPADPAATSSTNNGSSIAQAAKAAAPRPALLPQQAVANQVAVQLAKAAANGATKFNIRLHPAELGRVDVRLEISSDGRVSAVVLADRPETLELLRNDSRILERALEQAGLHADSGALKFGLRDQRNENENRGGADGRGPDINSSAIEAEAVAGAWSGGPTLAASGALDIHV